MLIMPYTYYVDKNPVDLMFSGFRRKPDTIVPLGVHPSGFSAAFELHGVINYESFRDPGTVEYLHLDRVYNVVVDIEREHIIGVIPPTDTHMCPLMVPKMNINITDANDRDPDNYDRVIVKLYGLIANETIVISRDNNSIHYWQIFFPQFIYRTRIFRV